MACHNATCAVCGSTFRIEWVSEIPCTIACVLCCHAEDPIKVTKTTACTVFGCTSNDLAQIAAHVQRNPYRRSMKMFLYLAAEARKLGEWRIQVERRRREENQREKDDLCHKRLEGLHAKEVYCAAVPSALFDVVFRDYFTTATKNPKTSERRVVRAYRSALRISEFFDFDRHGSSSAAVAHSYFASRPLATLTDLWIASLAARRVLETACPCVLPYLCRTDREAFVAAAFIPRLSVGTPSMRMESLVSAIRTLGLDAVLSDPACNRRVERFLSYPEHPKSTIGTTVAALRRFHETRHDCVGRRRELKLVMDAHKLKIRNDSSFCSEFITGSIDVDACEVAAIMSLTAQLFGYGHKAWSLLVDEYETRLYSRVFDEFLSWNEALHLTRMDLVRDPRRLVGVVVVN